MNPTLKIQRLWHYLNLQDDETMVVQSFSPVKGHDVFYAVEKVDGELKVSQSDSLPALSPSKGFQLIQQLDKSGKHTIPSVKQLQNDEIIDY